MRAMLGYDAGRLLTGVLGEAERLVPLLLDPDSIEDVDRAARELAAAVRAHRLAGKLENVDGRTPEEAAAFRAAAERLRS